MNSGNVKRGTKRTMIGPASCKLEPDQVEAIRDFYSSRVSLKQIAERMQLARDTVVRIGQGFRVRGVSDAEHAEIKNWWKSRTTIRQEAAKYGISPITFSRVAKGVAYKWLPMAGGRSK